MICRSCGGHAPVKVLSLGDVILPDFRDDGVTPPAFPLELFFCEGCGLTQLGETVPPELLFTGRYGYRSGVNGMVRADLADVVARTTSLTGPPRAVLDVAANDGTLLAGYPDDVFRVAVDPVEKFATDSQAHADVVISDFFTLEAVRDETAQMFDVVTTISAFYALDDPNACAAAVAELLAPDGVWTVQQNYLGAMLANTAYCNIVHEHVAYYSLASLETLLTRHGLEVFKVEENTVNGGSFRTYISHQGRRPIDASVTVMRQAETAAGLATVAPYQDFARRVDEQAAALHGLLEEIRAAGRTVFLYGASTRSNTFMQHSRVGRNLVRYAVERNPEKWGKTTSSGIPIISEAEGRGLAPDYFLVGPWFFFDEFLDREQPFIDQGGAFILPLPTVRIIPETQALAA